MTSTKSCPGGTESFVAGLRSARPHGNPLRGALRVAVLIGVPALVLAGSALPAAALERDDGDDPGEQLSKLEVVLYFGVVPIALGLLIALLVSLPSLLKSPRRAGDWQDKSAWVGAPEGEVQAVGTGRRRQEALTGRVVGSDPATGDGPGATDDGPDAGGSSARW